LDLLNAETKDYASRIRLRGRQNSLHEFPRTVANPQQVRNKLARAELLSVVSCPFPNIIYNDITNWLPTCCGLVSEILT